MDGCMFHKVTLSCKNYIKDLYKIWNPNKQQIFSQDTLKKKTELKTES